MTEKYFWAVTIITKAKIQMTKAEVIKYLKIERECISRNCNRNCGYCDLVQEQETLLDAYDSAISLLSVNQEDIDDNTKWNKEWIK